MAGRPKKPKYESKNMLRKISDYIDGCNVDGTKLLPNGQRRPVRVPILKECCLRNGWNYDYVMQLQRGDEDLYGKIQELLGWKEILLEQGMLTGVFKPGAAIFSLKQLGWTDRQDIRLHKGEDINDDELTQSLEERARTMRPMPEAQDKEMQ